MSAHKRIMVIDDDQDFISYVHIVLEASGYNVDTALSVADGLRKMRENPPDLVITDVMLSRVLNGWTIYNEMRADSNLAHIPILMVSAVVSIQDGDLFPSLGNGQADAFMSKPIEPAALLKRVAELIQVG
ncbi:MAG: response regulator transcription factor [Anaerolineae bacterium]